MSSTRDSITTAVKQALSSYAPAGSAASAQDRGAEPAERDDLFVPNPLGYALGWLVASLIVSERYPDSAIDAIPIHHPERGWDRFLLTRRVSCHLLAEEAANAFGMIELTPDDAPRITNPDGKVLLSLGDLLHHDAGSALDQVLRLFPPVGLVEGDHSRCEHTRASRYPSLYRIVAGLIAEHPGLVAARELFIDDQLIDGAYHPLFVHTSERGPSYRYDWFALQHAKTGYVAFVRINGRQSVYRTNHQTWASPGTQLAHEPEDIVRRRLLAWLRLDGEPTDPIADTVGAGLTSPP